MSELRLFFRRRATGWAVGIALPIAMLAFDPIVFRRGFVGESPMLGDIAPACYCAMALGMLTLGFQLRSERSRAIVSGVLAGAAVFATLLGLALAPLGFIGLCLGEVIGFLSVTPFLTALVFASRARLEFLDTPFDVSRHSLFWRGFMLYVAACIVVQILASLVL